MESKHIFVGVAMLTFSALNSAAAQVFEKGDILLCQSTEGMPDVMAWVGEIDTNETFGFEPLGAVFSLQIYGVEGSGHPTVGHSPFGAKMFADCTRVQANVSTSPSADFLEGYHIWKDAARKGEVGFWSLPVADAYWTILGVLPRS
ncbi:MAG: hypothetical protein COB08_005690 [Rhodobacteraceae bacterium]|nr:hypothetical protein [Paracoccaceae bacterium]